MKIIDLYYREHKKNHPQFFYTIEQTAKNILDFPSSLFSMHFIHTEQPSSKAKVLIRALLLENVNFPYYPTGFT
jgi:hypothetical protein